jgi:hypothetical protein
MSVYRTRTFSRWTRKQRLSDAALCDAVHEMRQGLYEADLGGGLLKKRIARSGQGKVAASAPSSRRIVATAGSLYTDLRRTNGPILTMTRKPH